MAEVVTGQMQPGARGQHWDVVPSAWLVRAGLRGTQHHLSIARQYTAEDGNSAAIASVFATYGGIACKL